MSRRPTKGFLEQDHSKKPKSSYPRKANSNHQPARSVGRDLSSLPVSSETKSKLSAFGFTKPATPQKPEIRGAACSTNLLDSPSEGSRIPTPSQTITSEVGKSQLPTPRRPSKIASLENPPQTPMPRLNITELLSDPEEKLLYPDSQPEDWNEARVTWARSTPGTRPPKRCASSSPAPVRTPSSRRQHGGSSSAISSTADPAMELWKKYGTARYSDESTQQAANPATRLFAQEGVDISPSNLRRAATLPSDAVTVHTRLKRRKTASFEWTRDADTTTSGDEISGRGPNLTKRTRQARVVSLLDQVKQNMTKSASKPFSLPVSSSANELDEDMPPSSPLLPGRSQHAGTLASTSVQATGDSDSEDYGDFDDADIDMEFLKKVEEIERTASAAQSHDSPQPPVPVDSPPVLDEFNEFDEYDEVFGSIEFEQLVAQYDQPSNDGDRLRNRLQRYEVVEVFEGSYQLEACKSHMQQKILRVKDVLTEALFLVFLRDSWFAETVISPGALIHVVGSFDQRGACIVDNKHNYIIVNPDFLVSATTVADTVSCLRKAVLQERVKATSEPSKAMVYGNVLHALLQAALEQHDFSTQNLRFHTDRILIDNIESLYFLREELNTAGAYVESKVPLLQEWANIFISSKPNAKATVKDHRGKESPIIAINKLLDIEERIWSPLYGLKGNIDATVQAIVIEPKAGRSSSGSSEKTLTVPLELKTGRSEAMEHRAQTMLYTLLMSDRYDINVSGGLLYYLETNEMIRVPAIRNELRELIIKRNHVASFILSRESLPHMLQDPHACSRCYAKISCFVCHKLLEDGDANSSGVHETFQDETSHLNEKHKAFFKHWDTLLSKEEKDTVKLRRELWSMTSPEREAAGRCFGKLVIVPEFIAVDQSNPKINRYTYSFRKAAPPADFSFLESQINEGDPVVVSDEKGHIALAIGYVFQISKTEITLQVDRRLHNARRRQKDFDEESHQVFDGIELPATYQCEPHSSPHVTETILFRIDRDEFSNGMAKIRNNLIQLMSKEAGKHRRLIVDLETPEFKEHPAAYQLDCVSTLNEDQKRAINTVMSARDYALVLGMPGTGKTTTLSHIIRALVSQGKSVLLTSYTHTAVDNILLKMKDEKFGVLRLGNRSKIHTDVQRFAQLADARYKSLDEVRTSFNQPKVVATTCLGINHLLFRDRQFDYCIVDEASQITLPVCLGPIRLAETFILVGDHYQLPPLVKNQEARDGGLDISLFKLLSDAQPQAVVNLEHQYRMCQEIMTLSNELIYSGRLKCGTAEVATRALKLPNPAGLEKFHRDSSNCASSCWLADLFCENVKACFIDTDNLPAREEKQGDRTVNRLEAELVFQIVEGFLSCGIDPTTIGVMTVYRSQLKLIQRILKRREKVEMHTADKFQGRDKEIVVISLVRSNDKGNVGELLRDWRRINVAFTRARSKLIILGSKSTLSSNAPLKDFVTLMERNSWIYTLPAEAESNHRQPSGSPTAEDSAMKIPERGNGRSPKRIHGRPSGMSFLSKRPVLRNIMNELN